jgi:hypothetical protein
MNYQTLFQTIQAYCENDFPDTVVVNTSAANVDFLSKSQIDTFIQQAEQRIYNSVQLPATRYNVTGQCTTGNKYLATPLDWLSTFSLSVIHPVTNEQTYLLNKDVEFIREAYPDPDTEGTPQHYGIFDNTTFILGPTPDFDYFFELHYFAYPQSIVTTNTSWLGNNFDSALLYGSLLEAYTFMKGEQDVQSTYVSRYNEALAMLKQLAEGKNRQDMYRTQQARYPVK